MPPVASRPHMPGYGILPEAEGAGLLSWSWASERLAGSRNYWVATVRPDGRPHVQAVWGVWASEAFWFSTGRESRKARNLDANPSCVITTADAEEPVVVEGVARQADPTEAVSVAGQQYRAKYDPWTLDPTLGPIFRVSPTVVFGLVETDGQFTATATRWRFVPGL